MSRGYDMTKRAADAARTRDLIASSTEQLLREGPILDITLPAIAEASGVTVQTVLRHMGSRDGCIQVAGQRVAARIALQRGHTPPGDVAAAVAELTSHYEAEGTLVLNLLSQDSPDQPIARQAVAQGRSQHRQWVRTQFGPLIARADREAIDALVAATDIYVWKLIRLDMGRSAKKTEAVIIRLVNSILEKS